MSAYGDLLVMIEQERIDDESWVCPYCGEQMPSGSQPSNWSCCGEAGHAVKEEA